MKTQSIERALLCTRADIVQYTIWHKTNTAPALAGGAPVEKLLRIDVNALGEYVDRLLWIYNRMERLPEWHDTVERLRSNIAHPWWQRKIAYFHAFLYMCQPEDMDKARQELKKAGLVTVEEEDNEILQLFIHLELSKKPFSERLAYLERALELSRPKAEKLQYRGAIAVQYFMFGDAATAEKKLSDAVELGREWEKSKKLSVHARNTFARLLQFLGSLREDESLMNEAIGHLNSLLLEDFWTMEGRASILREIGDCNRYAGWWVEAEAAYRDALTIGKSELDRIHLADSLLNQNRVSEAAIEIDLVDTSALDQEGYADYVFGLARIAIWSELPERLKAAKSLLEKLKTKEPYFTETRLTLQLGVASTLAAGAASKKVKAESTQRGGLRTYLSFLLLEPNIMGFGINFNAIIDHMLRKKPEEE